ncbi:MAG: DUF2058 domain-containing protein [Gammaproteobacteria bacterium]|nr:DUF2058 domain-containing protein [Gammaproteobacteria bacterium]
MAGSLFDQLKQAGLVDEKKAKKAKKEKYQQTKQKKGKKGQKHVLNESAKQAEEAAQQKKKRDQQLNLERKQAQEKRALQAELKQIIDSNIIKGFEGEVNYSFADGATVKNLHVNKKTHKGLVSGDIRLARFNGGVVLVPESVVERIHQRDAEVIIPLAGTDDSISQADQDYYAQFEIPDDLVW